jgi:hypothetical protein
MTRRMTIAVPAWGEDYVRLFLGPVLRSHRAALAVLKDEFSGSVPVRYVVQTDAPVAVASAMADLGLELTLVPPPPPELARNPMRAMSAAHAKALDMAYDGEHVVLLNADLILSVEALAVVERRFRAGRKAVVCCGTRVNPAGLLGYPAPMAARDLHAWSIRKAHSITRQCFWGSGRCHLPWGVYFRDDAGTVLRAFHLHPLAVVKDRDLKFGGTIDMDLIDNFKHDEIYIVTSADEMAMASVTPVEKTFSDTDWPMDVGHILAWALRGARAMHWWNFRHRIVIAGDGQEVKADLHVADEVLRLCPYPEALASVAA